MTLGGLALAVGILVDDATVEIENINRNLELGKEVEDAILDRRFADRGAGVRFDARHLHRVCADVLPERCGADICLFRWRRRLCSPCWRRISCRERSCPRWRSIC